MMMFRERLGTTPTGYLRRLRLDHARQDLIRSDQSTTTVTEIADRWGFPHAGRFAALYRRTYAERVASLTRPGGVAGPTPQCKVLGAALASRRRHRSAAPCSTGGQVANFAPSTDPGRTARAVLAGRPLRPRWVLRTGQVMRS
jgi:AraC-like DNA-binding protein